MLIPQYYGANELNGMQGNVIAIPSDDEVVLNIISTGFTPFGFSGPTANITGISNSNPCVITASNYFYPGLDVLIANVRGTSQLNGNTYEILSNNATSLTIDVDSTSFGTYVSGGTATLITPEKNNVPQIIAIGDVNSGQINGNGLQTATFVPGSFINVS
ncbi:MAG: hypothetical protein KGI54_09435 [Pseudomonadota bacterium]|nr:hypothetical protein [Pseudomonadota bacterium]